jgi:5'-deoxynucleotidase YfbR-like HD superfamily hydrolase
MTIDPDTQRNGDWIQTYTGRAFHYDDFGPQDICIEDIAHALSMECRYGGHTAWHYSVAQHSVHVYDHLAYIGATRITCKQGLLHDTPEAYVKDIPRPLKALLGTGYKHLDSRVWSAISTRYLVPFDLDPEVKVVDLQLALDEKECLLSRPDKEWTGVSAQYKRTGLTIPEWSPARAKTEFMNRFRREYGAHAA